ncbi:MAG: hypothetical protein IBX71_06110 [Candidatus Desulforudis sp.]|nr:hypothetical protein [Desulforudis sp.]
MWPTQDDRDDEHLVARNETGPAVINMPVYDPDEAVLGATDEVIEGVVRSPNELSPEAPGTAADTGGKSS